MQKLEQLKQQLESVEMELFILEMKDRWFHEDYVMFDVYNAQIRELKKQIKELEG